MQHEGTLDLEWTDPVTGGFDDVIIPSDEPVVTILILPGDITGVVPSSTEGDGGLLLIPVVSDHDTGGIRTDDDLPVDTGGTGVALVIDDVHLELGRGFTHGTRLRDHALQSTDCHGCLGLSISLHELQAGGIVPCLEGIGAQCLSGYAAVLQGGQVVSLESCVEVEPEHGGRTAERGDPVLLDHIEDLHGFEFLVLVYEYSCLHHPLTVERTPDGLSPSGVTDGVMDTFGVDLMPVLGSHQMTESVEVSVEDHLRVTRCTGGEVHDHGLECLCIPPLEDLRSLLHFGIEIDPSIPGLTHKCPDLQ